jgi:hypothetical protein
MARKAFDEGLPNIDELEGDSDKDSTLILQLLRDKISLETRSLCGMLKPKLSLDD